MNSALASRRAKGDEKTLYHAEYAGFRPITEVKQSNWMGNPLGPPRVVGFCFFRFVCGSSEHTPSLATLFMFDHIGYYAEMVQSPFFFKDEGDALRKFEVIRN